MRELRDRVKKCEYDFETVTDATIKLTASIAESDERQAGFLLMTSCRTCHTHNSRVGKLGDDPGAGYTINGSCESGPDHHRSIRIAENAEKGQICEESVREVSAKALRSVAEARARLLDAVSAATNEVRTVAAKPGVSIEERWSEHERDYDAMARRIVL